MEAKLRRWTYIGNGYHHDGNERSEKRTARFETKLAKAGRYEVRLAYPPNNNRSSLVRVEIQYAGGSKVVNVDQKKTPPIDGLFVSLGKF